MSQESNGRLQLTHLQGGMEFSHYRLLDPIGAGSMGIVFRAEDTQLKRPVAMKFLPEQYLNDEACKKRFLEEAQAAAVFDHPHIVTVHEASEFGGRPFIAMQYLTGGSLADVIKTQQLPLAEAVNIAAQVTSGLECAHGKGLVHRDVKPSNILLDSNGRIKLVDFGLATVKGTEVSTESGSVGGTPSYMSPEQSRGEAVDSRSDLFSVGVLLYELITGRRPFDRASVLATVQAVVNSEPDPLERYRAEVPDDLQRIVTKLLQKNPETRYQHAGDLLVDLRSIRAILSGQEPSSNSRALTHDRSIAVLPFVNLSTDRDQDYFCEGVAEEIINSLAQIRGLRVVARSSSFVFRDRRTDVRDIGGRLNVGTVLEGSVRKAGESLRITVQLIEVATGYHLWSERYDRAVEDIFAIQDEIAANVTRAMQLYMSDAERTAVSRMPTSNVRAYDYYLQGRQYFHRRRKKSMYFAIDLFKRAIELDSDFALAWATLADCCSALIHYYSETSMELRNTSDSASLRALELAPQSSEAHASRGFALSTMGDYAAARQEFETALAIDPNQWEARYYYGRVLNMPVRCQSTLRLVSLGLSRTKR